MLLKSLTCTLYLLVMYSVVEPFCMFQSCRTLDWGGYLIYWVFAALLGAMTFFLHQKRSCSSRSHNFTILQQRYQLGEGHSQSIVTVTTACSGGASVLEVRREAICSCPFYHSEWCVDILTWQVKKPRTNTLWRFVFELWEMQPGLTFTPYQYVLNPDRT